LASVWRSERWWDKGDRDFHQKQLETVTDASVKTSHPGKDHDVIARVKRKLGRTRGLVKDSSEGKSNTIGAAAFRDSARTVDCVSETAGRTEFTFLLI
jgi:hypothetical protein